MADSVRVWDDYGKESQDAVDPWDSWEKVGEVKGFPGGLVTFLQTSTDHDGCGFAQPTPVQAWAWPILQSGKDLVGVAKTGSGKTLAFLLPGFIKLRALKKKKEIDTARGPGLLTMTPTRELCYQIFSDAKKFGAPVGLTAACAYGGEKRSVQEYEIRNGPDCLIATPGRLNDFCNSGTVDLSQVRYAVLDEADRMLDMGFEPQIKEVMDRVSTDRQTAMFTATWPKECKQLADKYIKWPVQVQIGGDNITANQDITQHIEVCENESDKRSKLKQILSQLSPTGSCLIFCNMKRTCRDLAAQMRSGPLRAEELHGDLNQEQRDSAMRYFKSGQARVLVATDVAARGLDLRNITMVINFDAPNNAEDYVHRIGRTGRAGDQGDAYTLLLSRGEEKKAKDIQGIMERAQQEVPQQLEDLANGRYTPGPTSSNQDNTWWKDNDNNSNSWKRGADEAELTDDRAGKAARTSAKERMAELTELLEDGLITQEEFDQKRIEILENL
eukprot:TRINITY_DN5649_c0_g2_i1.p1 TRINITY_DN5649_c0_g2~~TRINITY_DN5649_c0_g2_i1.p1  ORF type:complete len:519 (-),score=101.58 TRINITY_DN5649_c0_g2_i1:148-1647(-)